MIFKATPPKKSNRPKGISVGSPRYIMRKLKNGEAFELKMPSGSEDFHSFYLTTASKVFNENKVDDRKYTMRGDKKKKLVTIYRIK